MDGLTIAVYAAVFLFGAAVFLPVGIYGFNKPQTTKQNQTLRLPWLLTAAAGGSLALLCFQCYNLSAMGTICFALLALLAAVALRDAVTSEIPNWLSIAIAVLAVLSFFLTGKPDLLSRIIGLFSVSLPLLLITLLVPDAFGGGDIKLMAACGLFLGWRGCLLAGFIAVLLGGLWGAGLLLLKKKQGKEHFAFGPFLCTGAACCALFEGEIVKIFLKLFDFSQYM